MNTSTSSHRDRLTKRLERNRAKRAEAMAAEATANICDHDWKPFSESIVPERTERQQKHSKGFSGRGAYFVVRGCPKCRQKRRTQLVVN